MAENTTYINAPKQAAIEGEFIPGRFFVKSMDMIFPSLRNSVGAVGADIDIRTIVTSFNITAELFSPILTLSGTIRDTDNLLGKFAAIYGYNGLTGQEKIKVKINSGYGDEQKDIVQTFIIKEYPNYVKTLDFPSNQIFTFVAVSEFAYTDKLMKICRPVRQNTYDNIVEIFNNDLGLSGVVREGNKKPESKFDGVITIQNPLSAAEWLRSRSFDDEQSPFFLYNKVIDGENNVVYFGSFFGLVNTQKSPSRNLTYNYRQRIEATPGSERAYEEEQTRILKMTSNLKLDRLTTAISGGYSNRLNVTDFASKSFYTLDYKTKEDSTKWLSNKYPVDGRTRVSRTLHNIPESSISGVQINSAPTYGDPTKSLTNSVTESLSKNIQRAKSFAARINEFDHEIIVYGNTRLNPGTIISLNVPSVPSQGLNSNVENDPTVSGLYLISIAAHIFVDGVYTCKLKLFKIEDLPVTENSQAPPQTIPIQQALPTPATVLS